MKFNHDKFIEECGGDKTRLTIDQFKKCFPAILCGLSLLLCTTLLYAADCDKALTVTFGHEGGYQCMRSDSGNWTGGKIGQGELKGTKYGIAANSYPHEDIKNLSLQRAAYLYGRDFWKPLGLDKVRSQINANEVFDGAVNMGAGTEARILQRAINYAGWPKRPLPVDGVIGPATIERMNGVDQISLYCHLIGLRYGRYEAIVKGDPVKEQFFRTWVYRIKDNVRAAVLEVEARKKGR